MTARVKRCSLRLAPLALILWSGCGFDSEPRPQFVEWKTYSGDSEGTKYSGLSQINRTNVGDLQVAWVYRADDMQESPPSTIECNPIVWGSVLYMTSPALKVIALEAATGRELWRFDPFERRRSGGVNRGVAAWEEDGERRIFFAAGNDLLCLDGHTGMPVETFGVDGRVDLREGLDRELSGMSVTATSPGIVFRDLLILGSAVGEGPGPAAPGHVRAYDVRTGARRWIFHTIPHPGEFGYETWPEDAWMTAGGANAWGGLTLDEERGWVFFGTGSPSYDHYGGNRKGENLFGNSVVALDAETGERIWHFQVVHHDLWDYDIACPPNLVTLLRDGREVDAVAQATKMGHLFVLDRVTGVPIFPVEERPVPRSEIPGEESWPTQPFPLKPPPYAQQVLTEDEVTDLSEVSRAAVLEELRTMRTGSIFLPPGFQGAVTLPQFNGGTDWGGAAFDPDTHMLYVNTSNEAEWISMVEAEPASAISLHGLGQTIYEAVCSNCHGSSPRVETNDELPSIGLGKPERELEDTIRSGRGQMPSFSHLSDVEIDGILAFLADRDQQTMVQTEGLDFNFAPDVPYVATGHRPLRDPEGFPANRRPWGTLNAIDLNRGEILWEVPLGTYPELEKRGEPPTGTFNMGGPLVTAGGLVFIGAAMDERFRAYDKDSGQVLWEYQLDAGGYATPATFEVAGRQYVVIAAGGGGKPETRPGNGYYCFSLP